MSRYCGFGQCQKAANWRTKQQYGLPGNPHTLAFCDEHKKDLGMLDENLISIKFISPIKEIIKPVLEPAPLKIWGGQ